MSVEISGNGYDEKSNSILKKEFEKMENASLNLFRELDAMILEVNKK